MIDLTIKTETEQVKNGTQMFLTTYKEQLTQFLQTVISNEGVPVDPGVHVIDGQLNIFELDPDKGFVLGETEASTEDLPLQLMKYTNLEEGKRYVIQSGDGKLYLCLKTAVGKPDPKFGAFKTLNDSVKELNSESVKEVMTKWKEKEEATAKIDAKTEKRLAKLEKQGIEVPKATMSINGKSHD